MEEEEEEEELGFGLWKKYIGNNIIYIITRKI
jgi:hypothetical protein